MIELALIAAHLVGFGFGFVVIGLGIAFCRNDDKWDTGLCLIGIPYAAIGTGIVLLDIAAPWIVP